MQVGSCMQNVAEWPTLYWAYGVLSTMYHAEPIDLATGARSIDLVVMASGTHPQGNPDLYPTLPGLIHVNWL